MALNTVNLTFTEQDSGGGATTGPVVISPTSLVTAAGQTVVSQAPIIRQFSGGTVTVTLVATDNAGTSPPAGFWAYNIQLPGQAVPATYLVAFASGASQQFSNLTPAIAQTTYGPAATGGTPLVMTTLGDIIYENAAPTAARLPGNTTTTRNFLTQAGTGTVSAAPAWGTIAVTDIPSLTTTFTFGSSGAAPSSGTYSAGQVLTDQNGVVRVCTAGGTPGTWRRAGQAPHQFYADDYGALGNGQMALVNVTNASKVITTQPLGPPAAPTLAQSSGGTVANGTYTVTVTYVNKYGETTASASTQITTTGSNGTITISSPASVTNETGWFAYVSQAGGSTMTRQQAAGSPTPAGAQLVLTAPPTSSGAQAPSTDTTAATIFNAATDVGKSIMVSGALGSPGAPLLDTIASVQSSTQATVTTNTATATVSGCAMFFSGDDVTAIDNCMTAARIYAFANNFKAQVIFSDKLYGLAAAPFQQSRAVSGITYNAQVRIPYNINEGGQVQKLEIEVLGAGQAGQAQFWLSKLPNLQGSCLVSFQTAPASKDATFGFQSVIGGPTFVNSTVANQKTTIKGITVVMPGMTNMTGIDLSYVGGCHVEEASAHIFSPAVAGVNPLINFPGNSFFQNSTIGCGLRTPVTGNNDDTVIPSYTAEGTTFGIVVQDHATIGRLCTVYCEIHASIDITTSISGQASHEVSIANWSNEGAGASNGILRAVTTGSCFVDINMDGENTATAYDISDPNNMLFGTIRWYDINSRSPVITGASNLEIINSRLAPGHMASPPAVPASGSSAVLVYRPVRMVAVHTGAGVTVSAITVDGTATGQTIAASSSLAIPGPPSGKTIALTYAGGTPTWDWWLD